MVRSVCFVVGLLSVLVADPAFAARWRKCKRWAEWSACPQPTKCSPSPCAPYSEAYCLQRKYLDYPGPMDLYECLTSPSGCNVLGDEYEELYYGAIHSPLVQKCSGGNCEFESKCRLDMWGDGIPGHEMTLRTQSEAWRMVAAGLAGAGYDPATITPRYFKIAISPTEEVWVIAVTIPPTPKNPTEAYIGLEMEAQSGPTTTPTHGPVMLGNGAQFQIDYSENGPPRRLYVWRK